MGSSATMAKKVKSRTIAVRLISMAMTGYYKTFSRPRQHRPLSMLKYDPVGMWYSQIQYDKLCAEGNNQQSSRRSCSLNRNAAAPNRFCSPRSSWRHTKRISHLDISRTTKLHLRYNRHAETKGGLTRAAAVW